MYLVLCFVKITADMRKACLTPWLRSIAKERLKDSRSLASSVFTHFTVKRAYVSELSATLLYERRLVA